MITFVVCGMGKEKIARLVRETSDGAADVTITSDFEGANAVQQGRADFYIGACQSGAGGALAVAAGVLGSEKVIRLSGLGSSGVDQDEIVEAIRNGRQAFGLAHSHIEQAVPLIVRATMAHADT